MIGQLKMDLLKGVAMNKIRKEFKWNYGTLPSCEGEYYILFLNEKEDPTIIHSELFKEDDRNVWRNPLNSNKKVEETVLGWIVAPTNINEGIELMKAIRDKSGSLVPSIPKIKK